MSQDHREARRHDGGEERQPRSAFERDRDRVLYSDAFRRLAGVTQVVHVGEGHAFHNRLTHSLKVAQVGRRLAERLKTEQPDLELDASVVETACLAHDLGHPPFGHIAEKQLDLCLRDAGVPDGYDGNAQAFRIVTKLSVRTDKHRGLNLCRATLNAILKYPWQRATAGKHSDKWGCFHTENDDLQFARADAPGEAQSLEASIMDWADDVTYAVHDVEDFFQIGAVPLDRLLLRDAGKPTIEAEEFAHHLAKKKPQLATERVLEILSELGNFAPDPIRRPFDGSRSRRGALRAFSSQLITRYVLHPQVPEARLEIPPPIREEIVVLKALMPFYVYGSPALTSQQYGQKKLVKNLFEIFLDAVTRSENRAIVPLPFREYADGLDGPEVAEPGLERGRLAADLVANMTEQQAYDMFGRLSGIEPGKVLDTILR